jgi:hypothetical protein
MVETFNELIKETLRICPNAQFGQDNDGQIIIYTNKTLVSDLTAEATDAIVEMPEIAS